MKKKIFILVILLSLIVFFRPQNLSKVLQGSNSKDEYELLSVTIQYPGLVSSKEYSLSEEKKNLLMESISEIRVIRSPFLGLTSSTSNFEGYRIEFEQEGKLREMNTFNNTINIEGKHLIIINRKGNIFSDVDFGN